MTTDNLFKSAQTRFWAFFMPIDSSLDETFKPIFLQDACVQLCSSKWMNLNQRQMAVFMEVGPMADRQLGQVGAQQ